MVSRSYVLSFVHVFFTPVVNLGANLLKHTLRQNYSSALSQTESFVKYLFTKIPQGGAVVPCYILQEFHSLLEFDGFSIRANTFSNHMTWVLFKQWFILSFFYSRGFSGGNLVGRWEQPRDASAVPSVSGRHAPYQHKLPHAWEDGTDPAGLPVPSGGPGYVQPLWSGKAWQEAVRSSNDLWNSLWVFLDSDNLPSQFRVTSSGLLARYINKT